MHFFMGPLSFVFGGVLYGMRADGIGDGGGGGGGVGAGRVEEAAAFFSATNYVDE